LQPVDESDRARRRSRPVNPFSSRLPPVPGKTELLTRRLLKLLGEVDEPEQILAITFTLAATAEMKERVLSRLHTARDAAETSDELAEIQLARRALENDARRGWNLLQQPERLISEPSMLFVWTSRIKLPAFTAGWIAFPDRQTAAALYASGSADPLPFRE